MCRIPTTRLFSLCSDHYIVGVKWVSSDMLSVVWAVRAHNLSLVTHCSSPSNDRGGRQGGRWRGSEARNWLRICQETGTGICKHV